MANTIVTSWHGKLIASAKADPKKAGFLTILVAVLAVMVVKRLSDRAGGPSVAVAATSSEVMAAREAATRASGKQDGVTAFQDWVRQPIAPVSRNLFAVNLAVFPQDGIRAGSPRVEGDGFWDQVAKSMSNQADARSKRQTVVENLQTEAAKLRLQTTMMGATPKALINGDLVKEGDVVASFRVLKIEARRIIIEREGIKLEILMN